MTDPDETPVSLTKESLTYLKESGGWGTFLAIVGFCYVALLVVGGLFAGSVFAKLAGDESAATSGYTSVMLSAFYVCFGVIYLFPTLYLFRFSQEVKNSLNRKSTESMTAALANLKSLFKFMGIVTIIGIGLFVLAMVSFGAGMLFN